MSAHNLNKRAVKVHGRTRYVEDPTKPFAPALLVITILLGVGVRVLYAPDYQEAQAAEPVTESIQSVSTESVTVDSLGEVESVTNAGQSSTSHNLSIEEIIEQVFGDQAENAKKIAMCESGMKPETIGDTHIMGMLDGEMVGDSIGLFQIRTGDAGVYDSKPWNRAKANGMTVEEFRTFLKNPENNIKYAKQIFERSGWGAWHNCAVKEGIR